MDHEWRIYVLGFCPSTLVSRSFFLSGMDGLQPGNAKFNINSTNMFTSSGDTFVEILCKEMVRGQM